MKGSILSDGEEAVQDPEVCIYLLQEASGQFCFHATHFYGLKEHVLATCLVDALSMSGDSDDAHHLLNWQKGGPKTASNSGNFSLVATESIEEVNSYRRHTHFPICRLDLLRVKATNSFELAYNIACSLIEREKYKDAEQLLLSARRIGQETLMEENLADDDVEIELAPIAVQIAYVQQAREFVGALPGMFPGSLMLVLLQVVVHVRENKAAKAEEILGHSGECKIFI